MTLEQIDKLLAIMQEDLRNDARRLEQEDIRAHQKDRELEIEDRKLKLKEK